MELNLNLDQRQTASQQMIQSMQILQMSVAELEEYLEDLAMENPVIDLEPISADDAPDPAAAQLRRQLEWLESTDYQNRVYYREDYDHREAVENLCEPGEDAETLRDYLRSQILPQSFSAQDEAILDYLLESLDERGYFTEPPADVAASFSCAESHIHALLREIQKLDPAGVGARDLSECLLLQLERTGETEPLAALIIRDHLADVAKNHQQALARKLNRDPEEIRAACDLIRSLNPKPGNAFSSREQLRYIRPDAIVVKLEGHFEILINDYQCPAFHINPYYRGLCQSTDDRETKQYLQEKIRQADWTAHCMQNRTQTLSRVLRVLVEMQEPFFRLGPGHKNPLRLSDLADRLDLHESTVSRCLSGKYLQCSFGVYPLKYFLTPVAGRSGDTQGAATKEQAGEAIRRLIGQEDPGQPYSDQEISDKLAESGIRIARRTVSKYRAELGIPDKNGRKSGDWSSGK